MYSSRACRRTVEIFLGLEYISDRTVLYILEHLVDTLEMFTVQQAGPNYSAQFCPLNILNRRIFQHFFSLHESNASRSRFIQLFLLPDHGPVRTETCSC